MTRCQKGTCPRMATRWACFTSAGGPVTDRSGPGLVDPPRVQMQACDHHGWETVSELHDAAAAREHNQRNAPLDDLYDPPQHDPPPGLRSWL